MGSRRRPGDAYQNGNGMEQSPMERTLHLKAVKMGIVRNSGLRVIDARTGAESPAGPVGLLQFSGSVPCGDPDCRETEHAAHADIIVPYDALVELRDQLSEFLRTLAPQEGN